MKLTSKPRMSPSELVTHIHVAEPGVCTTNGALLCEIGAQIKFSTDGLASYFFAKWEPIAWDALLIAAAVEFADMTERRPAFTWQRSFELHLPVHEPKLWNSAIVQTALRDALELLTGDAWQFEFVSLKKTIAPPAQAQFKLDAQVDAVIPFSNGLDSCAVAGLIEHPKHKTIVRIRLGSGHCDAEALHRQRNPFTLVPYKVSHGERRFEESSARSRGFKFALISGLAAFLSKAKEIIIPESGQGALGPSLAIVGQAYGDYRSHPRFTDRMEAFLKAFLGYTVKFSFPRIWSTKAQTLRQFVDECRDSTWLQTRSCWQQQRHSSVGGKWRQCGICAACMLRRMSVHAAGLTEPQETYVWENLSAPTFEAGAASLFKRERITEAMRQYAIAGTLHLDHLAGMLDSSVNAPILDLTAFQLSQSLGMQKSVVRSKLGLLLRQHRIEWKNFVASIGKYSFIANWVPGAQS